MSAAKLREAATVLRERAESVNIEIDSGHYYWAGKRENYGPGVRNGLGGTSGELAALMSPPVALALADWLDNSSRHAKSREDTAYPDVIDSADPRALAVADAILGDRA